MIWITWARQRRSVTLAECLGARLHVLLERSEDIHSRPLRYAYLSLKTIYVLIREWPDICCCQNPSQMLAVLLSVLRPLFRYRLVVDRHSNFSFIMEGSGLKWRAVRALSNVSLRMADVTVVTNEFLASYVRSVGGRPFVLQDKIPRLEEGTRIALKGMRNIVFVCSFAGDEPIDEVFEAARGLEPWCRVYVTGNYRAHLRHLPLLQEPPRNVSLTGFLEEGEYQTLLRSADVVLVLTTQEHTLTCGAYEAVALGKPVVASDTAAMRAYFRRGFVFTKHSPESIRAALCSAVEKREELAAEVGRLREELQRDWGRRFSDLRARLGLGSVGLIGAECEGMWEKLKGPDRVI